MLLTATSGGGDFELAPEGNHLAVCYQVVDLGMHERMYQGQSKGDCRKFRIAWELPNELMSDGQPFSLSKNYNMLFSERATLRQDMESWRGKKFADDEQFDIFKLIGRACMIQVVHNESNGNTYANVDTIAALPKGMSAPTETANSPLTFSLDNSTRAEFDALPEWLQKKINNVGSISDSPRPAATEGNLEDVPF